MIADTHIDDVEYQGRVRAQQRTGNPVDRVLPKEIVLRFQLFESKCVYCGKDGEITLDHFFPIKKGGRHCLANMVPACLRCNSSKKHNSPYEWMGRAGVDSVRVVELIRRINLSQGLEDELSLNAPEVVASEHLIFGGS